MEFRYGRRLKPWLVAALIFLLVWILIGFAEFAAVAAGQGPWIELFNGATWPAAFVRSKENPAPSYSFCFYATLSFRTLLNLGFVITAAITVYGLFTGLLERLIMTKLDSVLRTQNVMLAMYVLQILEDHQIDVPEDVEEKVLKAVREFGTPETGGEFRKRVMEMAAGVHAS